MGLRNNSSNQIILDSCIRRLQYIHTVVKYLSFVSLEMEFAELKIFYLFFLYCKLFNLLIADINECLTEAHNCSSDAACNNTKGAFYCMCRPGFTGDGQNCTGEYSGIYRLFPLRATLII